MVKCERTYPEPKSLAQRKSYNDADVFAELNKIFSNKCYICELQDLQDGVVEHLIPHKGNVALKFDWENLFLACTRCNLIKNKNIYDGKIIDCCKVDPEQHLKFVFDPYADLISIIPKDLDEKSKLTAQLITETFNLENTGSRKFSLSNRLKAFKTEWNLFLKLLSDYRKSRTKFLLHKLKSKLNRKRAFAAFKRDFIRYHQSEYPELQEFV